MKQIVGDMPVYLTFDIDCLDPAFAPCTGTPVIGGLTSDRAIKLVRGLKDLNIVGMDVVEVAPAYDQSEITALAAATWRWRCCTSGRRRRANNPGNPLCRTVQGLIKAQAAGPATAVKAHRILGDTVHTEADRSPGKPRFEGGDNPRPHSALSGNPSR